MESTDDSFATTMGCPWSAKNLRNWQDFATWRPGPILKGDEDKPSDKWTYLGEVFGAKTCENENLVL